jgi:hypothetical protein
MITQVLERGASFFSFIIGLGIAVLLFPRNYETKTQLAVPLEDATTKVSQFDGKCYRFRVEDASCEFASSL